MLRAAAAPHQIDVVRRDVEFQHHMLRADL